MLPLHKQAQAVRQDSGLQKGSQCQNRPLHSALPAALMRIPKAQRLQKCQASTLRPFLCLDHSRRVPSVKQWPQGRAKQQDFSRNVYVRCSFAFEITHVTSSIAATQHHCECIPARGHWRLKIPRLGAQLWPACLVTAWLCDISQEEHAAADLADFGFVQ